jgi:DNA ligase (NAD+)
VAKFHVNPETGETGKCSAVADKCPFGTADEHFTSLEGATKASEALLADQFSKPTFKKERVEASREVTLELIQELHNVSELYNQTGEESPLTDEEYDAKIDYLQSIMDSGKHEDLFIEGSVGHSILESDFAVAELDGDVVQHKIPMLSLAKAKKEPELISFLIKARRAGAKDFRLQAKLDGIALSARYVDGKLTRLATRGEGTQGEDTTYLIKDPNVTVKGLELTVSEKAPLEVRGELFFTQEQFKNVDDARFAHSGVRFKNSRNSAAGLMKGAKSGVDYPVEFTFAAYSVIKDDAHTGLDELRELGFRSVDDITDEATPGLDLTGFESDEAVMKAVHDFGTAREGFDFPTDGVVIKPTNEAEMLGSMGFTSHHPVSQIAWKYPDAAATTEVLAIDLTVGASGKVTPIARVRPVDLDGSTISNASLHNFNLVHTKGIRVGSVVLIVKANAIIPQVKAVISSPKDSEDITVPTNCPSCSTPLDYEKVAGEWPPKTMRCPNVDCESRNYFALKMAVGKAYMDIDGLSEVSLDYLHATGRVKTIADLYTLELQELADSEMGESQNGNARRLGEKRAQNIIDHIELSKTRPLSKMLPSISIGGMGVGSSKKLEKRFGDIDGILAASEKEIADVDGLGPISAEKIYNGLKLRRPTIDRMREYGVTFGKGVAKASSTPAESSANGTISTSTSVDLSGKSFAISGAVPPGFRNRGEWVDYVEANGGEFHSGPKAHTSFMIGDPSESSSKVKAATKHGLTFLSPEGFTAQFGS